MINVGHIKMDRFDESMKLASSRPLNKNGDSYALIVFDTDTGACHSRYSIKTADEVREAIEDVVSYSDFIPDELVSVSVKNIKKAAHYYGIDHSSINELPCNDDARSNMVFSSSIDEDSYNAKLAKNATPEEVKTASGNNDYILGIYIVSNEGDIKKASEYFLNNRTQFELDDQLKYASELKGIAEKYNVNLDDKIMKFASPKLVSDFESLVNRRIQLYKNASETGNVDDDQLEVLNILKKASSDSSVEGIKTAHAIISSCDEMYDTYGKCASNGDNGILDEILSDYEAPFECKYASVEDKTLKHIDSIIGDEFDIKTASDTVGNILNDSGIFQTKEFHNAYKIASAYMAGSNAHLDFMEELKNKNPELHKKYDGAWGGEFESGMFSPEEIKSLDTMFEPYKDDAYKTIENSYTKDYEDYQKSPTWSKVKKSLLGGFTGGVLGGIFGGAAGTVTGGGAGLTAALLSKLFKKKMPIGETARTGANIGGGAGFGVGSLGLGYIGASNGLKYDPKLLKDSPDDQEYVNNVMLGQYQPSKMIDGREEFLRTTKAASEEGVN